MRFAVSLLLAVHGLLHLLGFLKSWGLAALPELTGKTFVPLSEVQTRGLGLAWLAVSFTLLVSAGMSFARSEGWWWVAVVGALVSQGLILLQWHDAKAGTLANLLIAVVVIWELIQRKA